MAVLPMERITICAMRRDRKQVLERLQLKGAVEISDLPSQDEIFEKTDISETKDAFEKDAKLAHAAAETLDRHTEHKRAALSFLYGRTAIDKRTSDAFYAKADRVRASAQAILRLDREMAEAQAEITRIESAIEGLVPWLDLPFSPALSLTRKTAVFVGSLAGEHDLSALLSKLAEAAPALDTLHVEPVFRDKRQTCFYLICRVRDAALAEQALRALGFTKPAIGGELPPAEQKQRLTDRVSTLFSEIDRMRSEIRAFAPMREDLLFLEDHLLMRAEKYEALGRLFQSRHVFILEGYVLANRAQDLKRELESAFCCEVRSAPPGDDEDVPVVLKNSSFAAPTESVLLSYSLPSREDIDPLGVMSIFYYVMFGLMFSDAGYGFILAAVCGFCLLKFKNMEPGWKNNLRLFFWCGVSTVFWGIIFSSYFGDVVDVVSRTFFGREVSIPPVWFLPLEEPMKLLMFCLGIGVVHLTAGYVLKGVACARNGDTSGILYDSVFPIAAIYPLLLILMSTELFEGLAGFILPLPAPAPTVCLVISGISVVGVLLTGGRDSRNWGKRLLKGLYAVYNLLAGWLSDILSYSRLLALGLATGVIASVMNQLGAMVGKGIFGVLVFIVVFIIGQMLNFGINVLGAYVHSNRLEFVEFFGKFYEGGGRPFQPLGIHTKHYKIIEEDAHHG